MTVPRMVLGFAAVALTAGCARTTFQTEMRAGRWSAAVAAVSADSALPYDLRDLRDAALLHAVPDSASWDPRRVLLLLDTVAARGGQLPTGVRRVQSLVRHHLGRMTTLESEIARVAAQRTQAHEAAEVAREAYRRVVQELQGASEQRTLLHRVLARLEEDLRQRDAQLAALRTELDRLKAIDLGPPPGRPPPHP